MCNRTRYFHLALVSHFPYSVPTTFKPCQVVERGSFLSEQGSRKIQLDDYLLSSILEWCAWLWCVLSHSYPTPLVIIVALAAIFSRPVHLSPLIARRVHEFLNWCRYVPKTHRSSVDISSTIISFLQYSKFNLSFSPSILMMAKEKHPDARVYLIFYVDLDSDGAAALSLFRTHKFSRHGRIVRVTHFGTHTHTHTYSRHFPSSVCATHLFLFVFLFNIQSNVLKMNRYFQASSRRNVKRIKMESSAIARSVFPFNT